MTSGARGCDSRIASPGQPASEPKVVQAHRPVIRRLAIIAACVGYLTQAVAQDPAITRQPRSGLSAVGRSFTFDVAVTGTAPFTYQWLFNSSDIIGATNNRLTLTNLTGADIGVYSVRVSNSAGSVLSSNASLSMITRQPRGGLAAVGEDFQFDVEVGGTAPFTFQWRRGGTAIAGATNQILILTNLTASRSGLYSVRVSNPDGSIVSSNANLAVSTNAPRHISFFAPVATGPGACVETRLSGNGFENAVAFSLSFNTNLLANPVFQPDRADATAQQSISPLSNGLVGVVVQLPPGARFERGDQLLGQWCFDVISASNLLQAQLAATNQPVALTATNISGEAGLLSAGVEPRLIILDAPALNLQSGLFEQRIEVANPSAVTRNKLEIGVYGLGRDSQGNSIGLYNAHGSVAIDTDFDGLLDTVAIKVQIASLEPGEAIVLTMEFYVTDHQTVSDPRYVVLTGAPARLVAPSNPTVVSIRSARFVDDVFLVEFTTRSKNFLYYMQYASNMSQLNNPARVKTAFPPIRGTGSSVQWIDNGPPKTESPPVSGSRFYRVLEVRE